MFGTPDVARVMQLLEDGERLRVVARRHDASPSIVNRLRICYQDTIMHQETWARSFNDDNPNAIPSSCNVVSSQSHEYS